ncbi:MAG: hypothetical protein MR924_05095 [Prevotella sp.]|nr:hypothetical protein [Prevotella sp.]
MRLQRRISRSRKLLPTVALIAVAIWAMSGLFSHNLWGQFACFVVSTYLMVELNNSNALIRIYSRMMSCSYILLVCMSPFLFHSTSTMLLSICTIATFIALFITYQDKQSMGWTFYGFTSLGIASVIDVRMLYFAPVLWVAMVFYLRSMTLRTFLTSIFGLLCPYWFLSLYLIYTDDFTPAIEHFSQLARFGRVADITGLPLNMLLSTGLTFILGVTGIVHYVRNRINDKTRTRMLFNTFILVDIASMVFIILQPQLYMPLLTMMIITTSPLIAHFIALTDTRITNWSFMAIVLAVLSLTLINIFQLI